MNAVAVYHLGKHGVRVLSFVIALSGNARQRRAKRRQWDRSGRIVRHLA